MAGESASKLDSPNASRSSVTAWHCPGVKCRAAFGEGCWTRGVTFPMKRTIGALLLAVSCVGPAISAAVQSRPCQRSRLSAALQNRETVLHRPFR